MLSVEFHLRYSQTGPLSQPPQFRLNQTISEMYIKLDVFQVSADDDDDDIDSNNTAVDVNDNDIDCKWTSTAEFPPQPLFCALHSHAKCVQS